MTLRRIAGIVYSANEKLYVEIELADSTYLCLSLSEKQSDKLFKDFGAITWNDVAVRAEPEKPVYAVFEEGRIQGIREQAPRLVWSSRLDDIRFLRDRFGPFLIDEAPQQEETVGICALIAALKKTKVN